jgi:hypothetical protein
MTSQYGVYALYGGLARLYARIRTRTPMHPGTHMHARTHARASMYTHTLRFHDSNGFVNAPQCYVIRTLPMLLDFIHFIF